jgi:hypothetical protein
VDREQSTKDVLTSWLKQRLASITLIIAAIAFIFKEALDFTRTDKDFFTIVMSIGLTYLFAVYVALTMRKIGKNSAKASERFKSAQRYMFEAKENIKDISYLVPQFCNIKNNQTIKQVRIAFVEENGINARLYEAGFYDTESGLATLDAEGQKIIHDAKRIKIDLLTSTQLLTESSSINKGNPNWLGQTEKELDAKSAIVILLSKALFPIITSYFAVTVILGANIIWGFIQTAIVLLMGVMQYLIGEEEVLTILRNRYIIKGDFLIEFLSLYRSKPELFKDEEMWVKETLKGTVEHSETL